MRRFRRTCGRRRRGFSPHGARGTRSADAVRYRHEYRPYPRRGRSAVLGHPRTHPADRGQGTPQVEAPESLAQAAQLPRLLTRQLARKQSTVTPFPAGGGRARATERCSLSSLLRHCWNANCAMMRSLIRRKPNAIGPVAQLVRAGRSSVWLQVRVLPGPPASTAIVRHHGQRIAFRRIEGTGVYADFAVLGAVARCLSGHVATADERFAKPDAFRVLADGGGPAAVQDRDARTDERDTERQQSSSLPGLTPGDDSVGLPADPYPSD